MMVVDLQPFYGASAGAFTVIGIPKMFACVDQHD